MDVGGLLCRGCGSSNVTFNPQMRLLTCNQCGKEEFYERATLNANGKVVLSRQNAVNFFLEGKYDKAKHYAMDVLNISMDNVPALFIIAYSDEFVDKRNDSIRYFFEQVRDVALEHDEIQEMMKLVKASAYRLVNYEEQVIELFAKNMQSEECKEELNNFMDAICPYFISKRTSMDYLSQNLTEMYKELVEHCGIPKTCFALLKSIEENPDSPYASNSFFLSAKCKYYYEHYILPIGEVIKCITNEDYRKKFMNAYDIKCEKYRQDTGIQEG